VSALSTAVLALLAAPGVTAICGTRVHPIAEPPNTARPNIIVYMVASDEGYHMAGANLYPNSRVSIEVRAADAPSADRLGDAVITALSGVSATIGSTSAVFFKEGSDVQDTTPDFSIFRRIIDFRVRTRAA